VGPTGATEVVKAILARPDDASCNMLLLAGQCLAEDARVEESVRTDCVRRLKGILDFVTDAGLLVRVASVLSTTGDEDMVKYFEGLLRHDVMATRLLAVEVLETVGKRVAPERAALALISVLMDKDNPTAVRHAAAVSLGQLAHPGPEVLGALRAARESDPSPGVRAATVASLVSLGQAEALKLVRVPAGEFLMGSDEYEDEKPPHKVYLDEYHIGRYPVTNAEFDRFVQDGGYRNSEWWTDAGEKWRGDRSDRERYGGVFDLPNHPVVGVTWYEAAAYARWAGMRLPAEAEWEKAARGTDGRQWPWGNTFDASRCNSYESWRGSRGLLTRLFSLLCRRGYISGGTTPVGQYSPDGDSPYGVTDMAGNVWEWCRTKWVESYKEYEKAAEDRENIEGEADRVVRGGSWRYDPGHVRAAYRFGYVPSHRDVLVGFRVVCAVAGAR